MSVTQPPNLVLVPGTPQPRVSDGRTSIVHVVGARPNFVKMAPVIEALDRRGMFRQTVVHTGQHYDSKMSDRVLADLDFPEVDIFFAHSPEATDNLKAEGICPGKVYNVGNTMIDSLRRAEKRARELQAWESVGLSERSYILVTLHRPSNVDDPARLQAIVGGLVGLAKHSPVVFPIHPRTRARLAEDG